MLFEITKLVLYKKYFFLSFHIRKKQSDIKHKKEGKMLHCLETFRIFWPMLSTVWFCFTAVTIMPKQCCFSYISVFLASSPTTYMFRKGNINLCNIILDIKLKQEIHKSWLRTHACKLWTRPHAAQPPQQNSPFCSAFLSQLELLFFFFHTEIICHCASDEGLIQRINKCHL